MIAPTVPEKPFALPWHAEVFALAVHLNEQGLFNWDEWASCFGANLGSGRQDKARSNPQGSLDGVDDYYAIWLETLIEMVRIKSDIDPAMIDRIESEWRAAYLATPHGQPVRI